MATRGAVSPQMGAVILGSAAAFNLLGNLAFHSLVARKGTVGSYGVTSLFLSFGILAGVLSSGFQYAAARRVVQGGTTVGAEYRSLAPWLLVVVPVGALIVLWQPIGHFVRVNDRASLLLAIVYLVVTIAQAIPLGVLTGARRFRTIGLVVLCGVGIRLVLFPLLASGSQTTNTALVSSIASTGGAGLIALVVLARRPASVTRPTTAAGATVAPARQPRSSEGMMGAVLGAGLWGTWILALVFARHYLAARPAGVFSVAHVAAGAILFMAAPIVTAYVPTIARSAESARPVVVGLLMTVGISVVAVLGLVLLGRPAVSALYGPAYRPPESMLLALGISASLVASATFLLWAARSQRVRLVVHQRAFYLAVPLSLVLEVTFGELWHRGTTAVALGPGVAVVVGMAAGVALDWALGNPPVTETADRRRTPLPAGGGGPMEAVAESVEDMEGVGSIDEGPKAEPAGPAGPVDRAAMELPPDDAHR